MPLHADEPDATILRLEAVEFGRLDLPGSAHLRGPEGHGWGNDEERWSGVTIPDSGLPRAEGPAERSELHIHPIERMFPEAGALLARPLADRPDEPM
jgi:hypothetical protein